MRTIKNIFMPDWNYDNIITEVFIPLFAWVIVLMLGISLIFLPIELFQASYQAKVFNAQNGTSWTAMDFFMASDQINSNTQTLRLK